MLNKIAHFIDDNHLLTKDDKYLVALSGGADSVSLLLVMQQLGYEIEAVHCNFRLRGEQSDRDENFCKSLCSNKGIPFHVAHFDTLSYASLHKISIEMAARELRYNYFEDLRKSIGAKAICVAHHKDDSVETVFMNLIRGTGIKGLQGILPINGNIIRPLLCVSRDEIEDFLHSINQQYVIDSTNLIDNIIRNKLRNDIIPKLKEFNPAIKDNVIRTTQYAHEAFKILSKAVEESCIRVMKDNVIDILKLKSEISPEYILYYILSKYNFTSSQIQQIYKNIDAPTGKQWHSNNYILIFDRNKIIIDSINSVVNNHLLVPEDGTYIYTPLVKFSFHKEKIDDHFSISKSKDCISLDADKIKFPLSIRNVKEGDRFIPYGMHGSKLISDYLTDRKINILEKRSKLVITDSLGNIIWLVNERPDNRYCITKDTINSLVIRYITNDK